MGLTLGAVKPLGKRIRKDVIRDITFDASYASGGESLTASDLGLATVLSVHCTNTAGYVIVYDYANAKLMAFYSNSDAADGPLIEATGVDLDGFTCRLHAIGY